MQKRSAVALIVASLLFGFILGWTAAGGRKKLNKGPSQGQMSRAMAPGMSNVDPQSRTGTPANGQLNRKDWQNSMDDLQGRLDKNPKDEEAWRRVGELYAMARKDDQAIEAYQKALDLDPRDNEALTQLGMIYLNTNRTVEAEKLADEALKIDPNHPDTLFLKGTILGMFHHDRQGAITLYQRILDDYPDYPMADFLRQMIRTMKSKIKPSQP